MNQRLWNNFWLVVGPPLWKIWKSIGMMRFPIYGKIKNGNQTTNQIWMCFFLAFLWDSQRNPGGITLQISRESAFLGALPPLPGKQRNSSHWAWHRCFMIHTRDVLLEMWGFRSLLFKWWDWPGTLRHCWGAAWDPPIKRHNKGDPAASLMGWMDTGIGTVYHCIYF